ncbi:MAG TPA: glycosyltransferase family 4 protein [Microlunatus sp.]|nr:glycosyltransferase family 4 protein [Microlunatus sp.]
MRIAYVCTDPGIPVFGRKGASVHAQAVLTELVRAGHEVHLLTPRSGGDPALGDPRTEVIVHPRPAVGRGEAAARELRAQASDAQVAGLLSAIEPELVYERYALWGRTATDWTATHGVRSILEVNAPLVTEQAAFRELVHVAAAEDVARHALGRAGTVVCVSDLVADWARAAGARPDTVLVEPNGVDPGRISVGSTPVTPAGAPVFTVGFVGTLKPWHGLEVLVEAVTPLMASDPTWRLLLVGDGPLAQDLHHRLTAAGLADRAELTGAVAPAEVGSHLHRMDIACAPYPAGGSDYFSPLKVYEYLAAGLPVVASAVGQIPAALDHGRLGRLVSPGDPAALTGALAAVRADPVRRARWRVTGPQAVADRHTWSAVVQRVLAHDPDARAA